MDEMIKKFIALHTKREQSNFVHSRWDLTSFIKDSIEDAAFLKAPFEVSWQITKKCNLKCDYCYACASPDYQGKELSTEACLKIIDEFKMHKIYDITLEGGEVFMRDDIFEIIKYLKKNNLFVDILTNGYLINKEKASYLAKLLDNRVDGIQISIDSIKGKGISEKLKNIIKNLVVNGINVRVNVVLTKENIHKLDLLYLQSLNLGVRGGFSVAPIIPLGRAKDISYPNIKEVLGAYIILKECESYKLPISGMPTISQSYPKYESLFKEVTGEKLQSVHQRHCSGARVKVNISNNGDIYPCVFFQYENFLMGNILNQNLFQIWHSEVTRKIREMLSVKWCKNCSKSCFCPGGCSAITYAYHGDISMVNPSCLTGGVLKGDN